MRALCLFLFSAALWAQPGQQFFTLERFPLELGGSLDGCRLGFRTMGQLNPDGSNAVLWPTWFSGRSDQLEQYFGPGKAVDTSRLFVIAVDALANGVSCSPSNSQAPFPEITIGDMVTAEYRLATERFRLKKLRAVMGISMGGMQTFEWLVRYPGFVERAIPIVGSPRLSTPDLLLWQAELDTIEAVRKAGADLRSAMPAVLEMHQFALTSPGYHARQEPAAEFDALKQRLAADAARGMDPRDWAAQLKAMIRHDITRQFGGSLEKAGAAIASRVLVVVATQDHMVNPLTAQTLASLAGLRVFELKGDCGHLAPGCELAAWTAEADAFLR